MTTKLANFKADTNISNPTTHIPSIRAFFTNAVEYLGSFLKKNGSLSEEDIRLTKEVMIHLCYVEVLLSKIEKIYGDRLTERFDFQDYVARIGNEFAPYIEGRGLTSISLVALMDVNTLLEEIIKQIHAPYTEPAGPSLLDQLIMWMNNKIELLTARRGHGDPVYGNNSAYFNKRAIQEKPPEKWKPKPLEIVEPRTYG